MQTALTGSLLLTILKIFKVMKFFRHHRGVSGIYCLKKPILIMKLTFALIVYFNFQMLAAGYSQTKVTLNIGKAGFKEIISEIEKKSSYRFVFSERNIPLKQYENYSVQDKDVLTVVNDLLNNTPFTLQILPDQLLAIVPKNPIRADIKITGKVVDETGQVLAGATVKVKGINREVSTDNNGAFVIEAASDAVLVISYLGYNTIEMPVWGKTSLTIQLSSAGQDLNEVVVVGYGTQRKADVTGSIASVSSTAIARAATPDAAGALQGQAPGAVVVKNVGKPGSGYNITIRGISSFSGPSSPLFVIDGIPTTSGLNDLNPADIEKIDILKDASATAIYGSRGAKGVVIVTTKRGKEGKTTISYDGYMGIRKPVNLPRMFNGPEYVELRTQQFLATGRDTSRTNAAFFTPEQWENIDAGRFTDWPSLLLKNGLQMNHNISASGGDEKTQFAFGAGILSEEGNVSPEDFKRYSFRGSVDRQINEKWKAGMSFYAAQNLQNLGSYESLRSAYRMPPTVSPYDNNGNRVFRVLGGDGVINPLFDQENDIRQNRSIRAFGQLYIQVKPVAHLTLKTTFSPSLDIGRGGWYFGALSKEGAGNGGYAQARDYDTNEQINWLWDNQATYERELNGGHKLTVTAIQSMQKDRLETSGIDVYNLPYNSLWYNVGSATNTDFNGTFRGPTVSSGYTKYTLASARARINYSYKDKYLLTASGTWDGSSRFAEGNQWGFFPSTSFAWRLSEESFVKKINAINDLKLRLSYGASGNDRIDSYTTQATLGASTYFFGNSLIQGYSPNRLANKALTWETTKEINLGLDFALLQNRIYGTIDLYNRKIDNILLNRNLPAPSGWNFVTDNLGKLRNKGIEIGLSTVNIQTDKFSWKTDFVFDANKNEILETANGKNDDIGNRLFIGQPVQVNFDYVFDGIWQESERSLAAQYNQLPGQVRVKDIDNNGVINASDRQIIGKRVPNWTGSIANTFRYGNVDLYVLAYTRQGEQFSSSFDGSFMNYNQIYNQVKVDYWTPSSPSQAHFQPGNPGPFVNAAYYQKTNFVRISNITLGYTFPSSLIEKLKLNRLRVYATATNPFLFTNYKGYDPEWAIQNTYGTAVSTATYLFGVNLSF